MLIHRNDRCFSCCRNRFAVHNDILGLTTHGDSPVVEPVIVFADTYHGDIYHLVHGSDYHGLALIIAVKIGQHVTSVTVLVNGSYDISGGEKSERLHLTVSFINP